MAATEGKFPRNTRASLKRGPYPRQARKSPPDDVGLLPAGGRPLAEGLAAAGFAADAPALSCLDYLTTREEMRPVQRSRAELAAELTRRGLTDLEDLDGQDLRARYFAQRTDGLDPSDSLGRLVSAWVRGR